MSMRDRTVSMSAQSGLLVKSDTGLQIVAPEEQAHATLHMLREELDDMMHMRLELAQLREENLQMRNAMKMGVSEDWEEFKQRRRESTPAMSKNRFIGVDLGGTTVSVGLMQDDGTMLAKDQEYLKNRTFNTVLGQIVELCKRVVAKAGITFKQVTVIGVGSPGNLNRDEGLVINAANFQLWRNEPICERIAQGTGCCNVVLENDANAALMAEWWVGAAKGCSSVAMVTLGTGVGGGLILENQLVMGANKMASEFGHSILDINGEQFDDGTSVYGIAERYCSARAVGLIATARLNKAKEAAAAAEGNDSKVASGTGFQWDMGAAAQSSLMELLEANGKVECKEVFDHMAQGDEFSVQLLDEVFERIACLCINICRMVDPEKIVVTGGMALARDALFVPLREKFTKHHWSILPVTTEIVLATTGNEAGMIGAAAAAREKLRAGAIVPFLISHSPGKNTKFPQTRKRKSTFFLHM